MKKLSLLFAALVTGVVAFTASAEVLVYDGVPYANKDEEGGYSRQSDEVVEYQGVLNSTPTSTKIIGFDTGTGNGWNSHGSSTIYVLPSSCALSLPQKFVDEGFAVGGAAAIGFLRKETVSNVFGFERKLGAATTTSLSTLYTNGGKFYFRALMSYADDASYSSTSHKHAIGLVKSAFSTASIGSIPNTSLAIGMSKATGTVKGAVWLLGKEYDLGTACEAGKTYIGIIEVAPKAGEDGKARVRAFVVEGESFPDTPNWYDKLGGEGVDYVDVALESPGYMALMGSYGVNLKPVAFDEIALGTAYTDIAPLHEEGPTSGALIIQSNIEGVGVPTPGYGTVATEAGDTADCTAGANYPKSGVLYGCSGYTLETSTDGGTTWSEPVAYEGTQFSYTNEGTTTRLTWQWAPIANRLYVSQVAGYETFAVSPEPDYVDAADATAGGYYAFNREVTVTAIPSTEPIVSTFKKWTGDIGEQDEAVNPIVVTMNEIKHLQAEFDRPWVIDSATGLLVHDGWKFSFESDSTHGGYKITKCVAGSGVLDLSGLNVSLAAQGKSPVKAIWESVFTDNTRITGLILPSKEGEGIVYIHSAFTRATNLAGTLDLWSVTELAQNSFVSCSKLTGDLYLPELTKIGDRTFRGCGFSGTLNAPKLTTCSGEAPFAATAFTSAILPSLTTWPKYLFYGCTKLEQIVASPNFTKFGSQIFANATFPFATIELPGGGLPTYTDATFEANYNWKLAIVIPASKYDKSAWESSTDFVPLADIADVEQKANYDKVSSLRYNDKKTRIVGTWCNKWLLTYNDKPGLLIVFE